MVDLDDPRTAKIAEVMGNKTCKLILSLLGEENLSESELASRLKAPSNTINYNVKKLIDAGLIDPQKSFWSVKGRKVKTYKISDKRIVISPKTRMRGIIPAVLISGLAAWGLRTFYLMHQTASNAISATERTLPLAGEKTADGAAAGAASGAVSGGQSLSDAIYSFLVNAPNSWAWLIIGSLLAIMVIVIWNWVKD